MAVLNTARVCSKTQILSVFCLTGIVINFLVFSYQNSGWSFYGTSDEEYTGLHHRDARSHLKRHNSNIDRDLWSNIRNLLNTLSAGNSSNLPVLRDIFLSLRDSRDVSKLLAALVRANLTLLKPGVGNWTKVFNLAKVKKPQCPDQPPGLLGPIPSNLASVWPVWLEKNFASIQGGHYAPDECVPKEKTAIIIPYRSRNSHLHILLNNLLPVLIRQQLDFTIFVVEQAPNSTFNRAMLFNAGYIEALKIDHFDCFIFHDVDMIVLNDYCLYRCASSPLHLTVAISKWKYKLPYKSFFGGVVAFSREQFQHINGFSNLYFGWGGEDDNMRSRVEEFGYTVLRYSKEIGRFDTIMHMPDIGNNPDPSRLQRVQESHGKQQLEGLNTAKYNVTQVQFKPLYTWIRVSINMTEVLEGYLVKKKDHKRKRVVVGSP